VIILNFVRYQLRYRSKSFEIFHVNDQIIINADVLWVIQKLEKHSGFFVWKNLDFLDLLSVWFWFLGGKSIGDVFLLLRFFDGMANIVDHINL
jgi:hypothetical protein